MLVFWLVLIGIVIGFLAALFLMLKWFIADYGTYVFSMRNKEEDEED